MNLDRFTNSNGENLIKNLADDGSEMIFIKVNPDGALFNTKFYKSGNFNDIYVNKAGSVGHNDVSEMELRNLGETINPLDIAASLHGTISTWPIVGQKSRTIRVVTGVDLTGGSTERKRFMANRKNALREEMGGEGRTWTDFAFACATSSDTVPAPMVDAFDRLGFATEAMTLDEWVKLAKANAPATVKKVERNSDLSRFELMSIADGSRDNLEDIADGSMLVCAPHYLINVLRRDEEQRGLWAEFFASRFPNVGVYFIDHSCLRGRGCLVAKEYKDLMNRGMRFVVSDYGSEPRKHASGHSVAMTELFAHSVYLTGEDYARHFPFSKISTRALIDALDTRKMTDRVVDALTDKAGIEMKNGLNVNFSIPGYYAKTSNVALSEGVAIAYPELEAFRVAVEDLSASRNIFAMPLDVIDRTLELKEDGHENYSLIDRAWISAADMFMDVFATMFNNEMTKSEQGG